MCAKSSIYLSNTQNLLTVLIAWYWVFKVLYVLLIPHLSTVVVFAAVVDVCYFLAQQSKFWNHQLSLESSWKQPHAGVHNTERQYSMHFQIQCQYCPILYTFWRQFVQVWAVQWLTPVALFWAASSSSWDHPASCQSSRFQWFPSSAKMMSKRCPLNHS